MIKKRLIQLLSHAKKYVVCQVLWQWAGLFCQIAIITSIARFLQGLWDRSLTGPALGLYACVICAGVAGRFAADRMASRASYQASVDVKRILRRRIYEKLLRLGAAYRSVIPTAEVVQMSSEGVEQLETYFGRYLPQFFYALLAPLTLFFCLLPVNVPAAAVLLICVPLIPVSIVAVQKIAKRLLSKYWGIYTGLGDSFLENLQGLTTLKIYQADERRAQVMDREAERFRRITMKVLIMQLNSTSVMDIVAYGGAAAGMIVALRQMYLGRLDLAGVIMILLLAAEFFIPMRILGSFFHIAMNGMAASDKIFAFLDTEEEMEKTEGLEEKSLSIQLEDVTFAYRKREGEAGEESTVLRGIDMLVPAGSLISIVGLSGSGKSTIAGLLMGRNRGYGGRIRIGGHELSGLTEDSLMESLTYIGHASHIFSGSVEDNLRMGSLHATREDMEAALDQVNLKGFLDGQQGLETRLTESGGNLSGGQRQRLALARALLHDSPIYLFDEATSNIDVESESRIVEVIHGLAARGKTVILISHRLANVVDSDRIYMLEKGEIAESGRHEELLAAGGAYAALFGQQKELEKYSAGQRRGGDR